MSEFEFESTNIPELLVIRPRPVRDDRGWFMRTFSAREFAISGIDQAEMVQENQSRSRRNVLRGLHSRAELREAKLVRAAQGKVFDVVVDLRPTSPAFLQWQGFILDDIDHLQIRVPPGCAHGFQVLSDTADVCYKVDASYNPALDVTLAWDDPEIGITWPLADPILSARDRAAPRLSEIRDYLEKWYGQPDA